MQRLCITHTVIDRRISKLEAVAFATTLFGDYAMQKRLLRMALEGCGKASFNAAWILVCAGSAVVRTVCESSGDIVGFLTRGKYDEGVCRLLLTLLRDISSVDEECRALLFDFCLEHIPSSDTAPSIRSLCVKIAHRIALLYPELMQELRLILEIENSRALPASVRNVRNKALLEL